MWRNLNKNKKNSWINSWELLKILNDNTIERKSRNSWNKTVNNWIRLFKERKIIIDKNIRTILKFNKSK
jgi:hypothetical protein